MILTIRHTPSRSSAEKEKKQAAQEAGSQPSDQASSSVLAATDPKRMPASAQRGALQDTMPFANVRRGFKWLQLGRARKRLQMLETVSLGEKRFVALVQVDGRQFLIGGAPSNVGMLAELAPEETFQQVLREATEGLNISAAPLVAGAPKGPSPQPEPLLRTKAHDADLAGSLVTTPGRSQAAPSPQGPAQQGRDELKSGSQPGTPAAFDNSLDPVLETPFSLSPTLLAAVQKSTEPAVHGTTDAELGHEERSSAEPSHADGTGSALSLAPSFTFQLSSSFPLKEEATLRPSHSRFGRDAAQRMVSAWRLKGATS